MPATYDEEMVKRRMLPPARAVRVLKGPVQNIIEADWEACHDRGVPEYARARCDVEYLRTVLVANHKDAVSAVYRGRDFEGNRYAEKRLHNLVRKTCNTLVDYGRLDKTKALGLGANRLVPCYFPSKYIQQQLAADRPPTPEQVEAEKARVRAEAEALLKRINELDFDN